MSARFTLVSLATLLVVSGSVAFSQSQKPAKAGPAAPPTTDAAKIASAMSAAPAAVADHATIMDMAAMKPLRQGANGWTCLPDMPHTPGADPMCLDQNGMEWAAAWMNHADPPKDKMGFGYMLVGGSDASNTDPFATAPKAGERWVDTGPHVMVFNIGDRFTGYPASAANTKVPYVMFAGTPYAPSPPNAGPALR